MLEQQVGFGWVSFFRGIIGIFVILCIGYALSTNRKRIDWKLIGSGLFLQIVFALAVLYVPFVGFILEKIGKGFVKLVDFTNEGVTFLLGPYASQSAGFVFLIHALPIVIFFSALVSIFYHWGIIQRVVAAFSWCVRKFMKISGAEGLVSAGNIFMGMTESPILIKKYLPNMNRSEIFLVMISGMGTIAGSVMGAYISILGGTDPAQKVMFATHLLSASVMAVPGSIVIAKMICPQTEPTTDQILSSKLEKEEDNVLTALATGTSTGIRLMVNIAAMLLVFISLIALVNYITEDIIGKYTGINDWIYSFSDGRAKGLTIQFILGLITAPFVWLIGIPSQDIIVVGSLLGQKTILNEFVAYGQLEIWKDAGLFMYEKSVIMSTYILCGFANISSIGILMGGLGVLAPEKRTLISQLSVRSMIGGGLVSILSATIIGMILG